jgi:broad specificity phosphatase PhoE
MGEIILVRHGQANSTATDESSYDRLSDLGRRQGAWLGEWLAAQGEGFDLVLSGSLNRHLGTAEAMGHRPEIDPRLNEMDYFNLSRALSEARGTGPATRAISPPISPMSWRPGTGPRSSATKPSTPSRRA